MGFGWRAVVPSWKNRVKVVNGNAGWTVFVWASASTSRTRWEVLGWSQGGRNARETTRLLQLNSFEFMVESDLESNRSIMRYLRWSGENAPWPIT